LTSDPGGVADGLPAPRRSAILRDHDPVAARLRRLPPANFQHASGVSFVNDADA
jgi:hypothetical protein